MAIDALNPPDPAPVQPRLKGREIIVGVCGGIAAYKVADVVSKLVQLGAGVSVVMTVEAQNFVTPLTFEALSGRKVRTSVFDQADPGDTQHIGLTERADLMLIAPATNNIIAKVAHGLTDDLVSLMICAAACPVVFAPSMNHRMWDHPIAQENVAKLTQIGYRFIGPESGWLACRNVGAGRLSEPQRIVDEVVHMLTAPGASEEPAARRSVDDIRRRYPRAYEKWTPSEEGQLRQLIEQRASVAQIANRLQRQRSAIRSRILKLDLVQLMEPGEASEIHRIAELDSVPADPSADDST